VAGNANTTGNYALRATLWSNGGATNLGTLKGTNSYAYAINDSGQIAGDSFDGATLWSNGSTTYLGTLGGYNSSARAINNSGKVAGLSSTTGNMLHATLWSNGSTTDLGTLGGTYSYAYAINNSDKVAGASYTTGNAAMHATLWSNGNLVDLNSLVSAANGWTLISAQGINDLGQIVGYGTFNGQTEAFLLTPDATPTPIPAAAWLFGSGLMGLVGVRRKKRQQNNKKL
jgi:probable HAF family extracellular repeat protein